MGGKTKTTWRSRIVGTGEEPPDQLVANPRNWRTHPGNQRDALRGSLDTVGWVQQVMVNRTTGHVVDGHARVEEALSRGDARLTQLLAELGEHDAGLDALLASLAPEVPVVGLTDPDDVPEVPEAPYVKMGDLWLLGDHRLLCGDSTDADDMARLCDATMGAVLTDPPYGINLDTDYTQGGKAEGKAFKGRKYRPVIGDDAPFDASMLSAVFADVEEQFWFGADYYRRTIPYADGSGCWLVWDKRVEDAKDALIGSAFELAWSRGRHQRRILRHQWTNWTSHHNAGLTREHPTEKPVSLLRDIIERWVGEGVSIADPFAGSGTTIIAAEQTGRRCYAMEIDPRYVQVAKERWEAFTGRKAVLDGTSDEAQP